jgi:hypothetical protein
MGSRATLRADLRRDLRDEDASAYVWTDAVLNRHLQHAIDRLQAVSPRQASVTRTVPLSPRRIDLSADVPATFSWVEAVEYPIDASPQAFLPFREEPGPKVYLLGGSLPAVGDQMRVWYAARFTVDDASSDMPVGLEPTVLAGALAFACLDQAIDTVARITPAGAGPAGYRAAGDAALRRFEEMVAELRARAAPTLWRPVWRLEDER